MKRAACFAGAVRPVSVCVGGSQASQRNCVLLAAGASAQLCFSPVKALGAVLALGVSSSLLTQIFVLRSVGYRPRAFPHPFLSPCSARGAEQDPAVPALLGSARGLQAPRQGAGMGLQAARIAPGSPETEHLHGAEPACSLEQCSCSLGCLGAKKDFVGEVGRALLALGLQTLL